MNIDIGQMPLGKKPPGFTEALTGQGEAVSWRVLDDPSTPAGKVIAEISRDTADYRFPLCIYDGLSAKDVEVAIRFRAVDGSVKPPESSRGFRMPETTMSRARTRSRTMSGFTKWSTEYAGR
jgi:hypothetical protein